MDRKDLIKSDPYKRVGRITNNIKNIYYGEVVDVNDPTEGGIIKVKILGLDNKVTDFTKLPDCYPMLPKFFHLYPKVGEVVRIFIEDIQFPDRGRYWMGSVISQPHKMEYDSLYTALSTSNSAQLSPDKPPSSFPDAVGVYPTINDVGIIGRINTDVILRDNQVELRAGKHFNGEPLKLNVENPASLSLTFEPKNDSDDYRSVSLITSDKIALISHDGIPKFKAAKIDSEERTRIFNEGHPIVRGDVLVEALNIIRNAIINHIHGYSKLPADKDSLINDLENINFEAMLQKNIVTN